MKQWEIPTPKEEYEFHWSHCPACGILVNHKDGTYQYYTDEHGQRRMVPAWLSDGSHLIQEHGDNRYAIGKYCFPNRIPLPKDSLWISFLKWVSDYNKRQHV